MNRLGLYLEGLVDDYLEGVAHAAGPDLVAPRIGGGYGEQLVRRCERELPAWRSRRRPTAAGG